MPSPNPEAVRSALLAAKEQLLQGQVPGPLTSIRLVEVAGVKRHRLTHDNPDINEEFQRRAREINRTKPEVDGLRARLDAETKRNKKLVRKCEELKVQVEAYASALCNLLEENARLEESLRSQKDVPDLASRR